MFNEHIVESERMMIAGADRVVVLGDHSKIGKHLMCQIANLKDNDALVTDRHPDTPDALKEFEAVAIEALYAESMTQLNNPERGDHALG